jgi:Fe(3+) dicitrate transport protein
LGYSGDEIPICKNQLAITAALETTTFPLVVNTMPSGRLLGLEPFLQKNKVPSNFIIDLSARYHISEYISLMGVSSLILDKECRF